MVWIRSRTTCVSEFLLVTLISQDAPGWRATVDDWPGVSCRIPPMLDLVLEEAWQDQSKLPVHCDVGRHTSLHRGRLEMDCSIHGEQCEGTGPGRYSVGHGQLEYSTPVDVQSEWVLTECPVQGTSFFSSAVRQNLAVSVLPKEDARRRAQQLGHDGIVNMVWIVCDGLSRAQLLRVLPKTAKWLWEHRDQAGQKQDMKWFHMERFNVAGVNTPPNFQAMWTGRVSPPDRERVTPARRGETIWDEWRRSGHVTMYYESACTKSATSISQTLGKWKGFADHLMTDAMCSIPITRIDSRLFVDDHLCFGGTWISSILLDYLRDFWDAYSDVGRVAVVKLLDPHTEFSQTRVTHADQELTDLLEAFSADARTVVALLGDHGQHYGPFFQTDQGSLEHKLPALWLGVPQQILDESHGSEDALRANQHRFVTPIDLYQVSLDHQLPRDADRIPADELAQSRGFTSWTLVVASESSPC